MSNRSEDQNGVPDGAFPAHHANMMADFAIAPYRQPGALLTRNDALEILDRIIAPHTGSVMNFCYSASPQEISETKKIDNLVDARPGSDFGKLIAVCFSVGDTQDVDLAVRKFENDPGGSWASEVLQPMLDFAKISEKSAIW